MDSFGFEFYRKIWDFLLWLWLGLKEKEELERVLSKGTKNDGGVTVLWGLGPNMYFIDVIGQFENVLDLSDICPILRRGNRVSYAFCNFHKERKWESFFFF